MTAKARKPNIVLIITDHHAYYRHHRPGEFELCMPHFGRLAMEGARFDRAYSVCPICTPARASMMTGLYPSAHGLRWNTEAARQTQKDFRSGQLLYSHYLSQAGYRNAYVGKWHCGHQKLPVDFGIEGWSLPDYGRVYMSEAYRRYAAERGLGDARAAIEHNLDHPEWDGKTLTLHDPSPWRFMNGSGILIGPPEAHEQHFVAHLAVQKLRELAAGEQPFSLVVSFWGPHQPYFPTESYAALFDPGTIPEYPSFDDDYSGARPIRHFLHRDCHHAGARRWREWGVWQEVLARCYGQIMQTDAAVGQVLAALDDLDLADDTLVIGCSDHGDAVASHDGLWDKASTYSEEVARVPMVLRWPGEVEAGLLIEQPVTNMDVTATMLAAAGIAVPQAMHSRSLLPYCRAARSVLPADFVVCEHNGHGEELLQRIIVRGKHKYVAALFDLDELYDLEQDPYEMDNLVHDPAGRGIRDELRGLLIGHMERIGDREGGKLMRMLRLGL